MSQFFTSLADLLDISPMSFNPSTVGGDDLGNSRGDFFDSSGSLVRKRGAPKTSNTAEGTPPPQPQQPGFYPQGIPPDQIRTSPSLKTQARPLTCYLPNPAENFDLKSHLESLGHWMQGCRDILVDEISCRGPLLKRSSSLGVSSWKRRWFVFDRVKKTLVYYSDFKQCKLKGGVPFSSIQEVYFDHLQQHKSPNPNFTFIVKTKLRPFSLVAPTASCMRMWMDAIVTGCEGNDIYTNTNML